MFEQQAQGGQLHALGGQRLIDFVGQRGGHLPQRGEFGRLHQTFLRGAQVAGALLDQTLEFFAIALTDLGQPPALIEEQQQEHQRQPHASGGQCGVAQILEGHLRTTQQVQGPAFGRQRQRFPQIIRSALRTFDPAQIAVVIEAP